MRFSPADRRRYLWGGPGIPLPSAKGFYYNRGRKTMQENFNATKNGEEKNNLIALRLRSRKNPALSLGRHKNLDFTGVYVIIAEL